MNSPNSGKKSKRSNKGNHSNNNGNNNEDTLSKEELIGLVTSQMADQMARVLPDMLSQLQAMQNEAGTPKSSSDSKTDTPKASFQFKHFMACKPVEFTGTDGATALINWFDAMELIFLQGGCPEELRTLSATGVFRKNALEWWTMERNKRGNEAAHALTWDELKQLMRNQFCPPHEIRKLENEFWNLTQQGSDVEGLITRFKQLSIICPGQVDTVPKAIAKLIHCLSPELMNHVAAARPKTIEEAFETAIDLNNNCVLQGAYGKVPTKHVNQAIADTTTTETPPPQAKKNQNRNKKRKASVQNNAVVTPPNPNPLNAISITQPTDPTKRGYTALGLNANIAPTTISLIPRVESAPTVTGWGIFLAIVANLKPTKPLSLTLTQTKPSRNVIMLLREHVINVEIPLISLMFALSEISSSSKPSRVKDELSCLPPLKLKAQTTSSPVRSL